MHLFNARLIALALSGAILSACSGGGGGAIPPQKPVTSAAGASTLPSSIYNHKIGKDEIYMVACSGSSGSSTVTCGNDRVTAPDFARVANDGTLRMASGARVLWFPTKKHWYYENGKTISRVRYGRAPMLDCTAAAQAFTRRPSEDTTCNDGGATVPPYGSDPSAPTNAFQTDDGSWFSPSGMLLQWCDACYTSGGWVGNIGSSGPANPAYDPALQPYVDAGNFANNIEPWFYSFAMPADVPVGGLIGKFGGRFLGRFGTRLIGSYLSKLASAVGDSNFARISADWLNSHLPGVTAATPPFAAGSQAAQFTVTDGFNQAFQGAEQLVRVTTDNGNPNGSWWTTLSQITNEDGSLMSAAQIQDVLALPNTPTTIYYAGGVTNGVNGYMGIVGPNFGQAGGALQFYFDQNVVNVIGSARLGP